MVHACSERQSFSYIVLSRSIAYSGRGFRSAHLYVLTSTDDKVYYVTSITFCDFFDEGL